MASYFSFFPSLLYGNTAVTNVLAKIRFQQSVARNLAVFYPYTIEQGERADQVANFYYGSPEYDWVVYLSNDIVDPYHEWPKSEEELIAFIKKKYGSTAFAQSMTSYYQNNFETDDTFLTTAAYDALSGGQKKYWRPQTGYNDNIVGYVRKELETIVETNKVLDLAGVFPSIGSNTMIKQSSSVTATVGFANSSLVTIKHVSGTWQANLAIYDSNGQTISNATINTITTVHQPIPSDEMAYWSPVSYYDAESISNEKRKNIRLLNVAYLPLIERDMKDLLST